MVYLVNVYEVHTAKVYVEAASEEEAKAKANGVISRDDIVSEYSDTLDVSNWTTEAISPSEEEVLRNKYLISEI